MKKLIFSALAAIGLLLSPSCSDENEVLSGSDNEALVSFNVNLADGISTKATSGTTLGDGTKATNLVVEVYEADAAEDASEVFREKYILQNLKKDVTFTLVKGKKYDIIFWAQNQTPTTSEGKYYDITDLRHIGVNYTNMASNNENRDAFVAVKKGFSISGPEAIDVKLTRPFAQVNFMVPATDIKNANNARFSFATATTGIKISDVATQLNPLSNTVEGTGQNVVFTPAIIPFKGKDYTNMESSDADKLNIAETNHYYLATTYILVNATGFTENPAAEQALVNATLTICEDGRNETHTIPVNNIPVQMNYRTNIYGNLLTAGGTFNVEINNGFGGPDENVPTTASVSSFNDLTTALRNTNITTITLGANIELTSDLTINSNVTIQSESDKKKLSGNYSITVASDKSVTFKNVDFANGATSLQATNYSGTLKVANCKFTCTTGMGNNQGFTQDGIKVTTNGGSISILNNEFTASTAPGGDGNSTYINITSKSGSTDATAELTITGNSFGNCNFMDASGTIKITNLNAANITVGSNRFTVTDATKYFGSSESFSVSNNEGQVPQTADDLKTYFNGTSTTLATNNS